MRCEFAHVLGPNMDGPYPRNHIGYPTLARLQDFFGLQIDRTEEKNKDQTVDSAHAMGKGTNLSANFIKLNSE